MWVLATFAFLVVFFFLFLLGGGPPYVAQVFGGSGVLSQGAGSLCVFLCFGYSMVT